MVIEFSLYNIYCEWGEYGVFVLVLYCDVVIVVDVLFFCICVDVVVVCGVCIYLYLWCDVSVEIFVCCVGVMLVGYNCSQVGYMFLLVLLCELFIGSSLVLFLFNGVMFVFVIGLMLMFVGCLCNVCVVVEVVLWLGCCVVVVVLGECWVDGSLCLVLEDWLVVGVIVYYLLEMVVGFLF